ncbi:unnamed protein product [Fusarium graminearum]|uniref:Chromosome 2, complete genome n=1 Tax=Gibberella zeae (strain ATCC MYA-4620 / CBS 123657 / FGSC 9075 / NRRL 31084 / PH-1) TaxID=229533 RepID=A0A0E0RYP9_GIBZE|nr:hypothetical protein FG05_08113 [Fusarium graminearum]CEF76374.1 unnamed protein product [Fusarium graminearum]
MHLPNDNRLLAAILALFVSLIYLKLYRKRFQTVTQAKKARTGYLEEISDVPDAEFEIIAVHGLAAHAEWTWVQVYATDVKGDAQNYIDEERHLLRGLLKSKCPTARILSFVDDSTYLGKESVLKTTEEIGKCLLKEIKAKRRRPALCTVGSEDILQDTCGIIFLGTPHQGSSLPWLGSIVTFLTKPLGSDTTLVMSLTGDNSELSNLGQRFEETLKTMARRPHIVSFYETKVTFLGWFNAGLIVGRNSATLHATETEAIDADHSGLNKCFGDDTALLDKLVRYIDTSRAPSSIQQVDHILRAQYDGEKSYKTLSITRLSGKALPMGSCYINLSIVDYFYKGITTARQNSVPNSSFLMSSRKAADDVDKMLQVDLASMFDERERPGNRDKKIRPRRILIRGRAGVGKTTLCKKMVYDYINSGMWNSLFDRVLWIPLRNLKGRQGTEYNLKGLFYDEFFSQIRDGEKLAGQLWEVIDGKTLFILDGMDEVSQLLGGDGDMTTFLTNLLNQDSVVITSRPSVSLPPATTVDLELETIGFSQKQVEAYLRADPEYMPRADKIQSLLQRNWLLRSLVRIPIQLDALCFIWEDVDPDKAPETMTGIYSEIAQKLWTKDLVRIGKGSPGYAPPLKAEIENEVENEIALLEYLAFNGLCNDMIDFSRDDLHNAFYKMRRENPEYKLISRVGDLLADLSFMRSSDPSQPQKQQTFHFIHLTYQEYFAARWFKRRWEKYQPLLVQLPGGSVSKNADDFVRQHKYTARFNVMWRFVSGLCDLDPSDGKAIEDLFDLLGKDPIDLLGATHHRLLMHCLAEVVKSVDLRATVEEQLSMWLEFECSIRQVPELLREAEFPAGALNLVFQQSSDRRKLIIVYAFKGHLGREQQVHGLFPRWLKDPSTPRRVRLNILYILTRFLRFSSIDFMNAVVSCLDDKDKAVADEASRVLEQQREFPQPIEERLLSQLLSRDPSRRRRAAAALRGQLRIPHTILAWLDDGSEVVKLEGLKALPRPHHLPTDVYQTVANLVGGAYSDDVVEAALDKFPPLNNLPDNVLHVIAAQLQHPKLRIRRKSFEVLYFQMNLPNAILQIIVETLAEPSNSEFYTLISLYDPVKYASDQKRNLKVDFIKAAVARLGHDDATFRMEAAKVLDRLAPFSFDQCRSISQHLQREGTQESDPYRGIFFYPSHSPGDVLLVHGEMSSKIDDNVRIMGTKIPWNIRPLSSKQMLVAVQWLESSHSSERIMASLAIRIQSEDSVSVFRLIAPRLEVRTRDTKIATLQKLEALAGVLPVPHNVVQEVAAELVPGNQPINEIILRTLYEFSDRQELPKNVVIKVAEQLDAKEKTMKVIALGVLRRQTKWSLGLMELKILGVLRRQIEELQNFQGPILRKIVSQLNDEDANVKQLTLSLLSEYRDALTCDVIPVMEQLIRCSDDGCRKNALKALPLECNLPQSTLEAISMQFEHERPSIRQHALQALHERPELPQHILDKVKGMLLDPEQRVRQAAIKVLGSQKTLCPEILLALAETLGDTDGVEEIRDATTKILCSQSKLDKKTLAVMINIAKGKANTRTKAISVLKKHAPLDRKFMEDIAHLIEDKDRVMRCDVIDILGADTLLPEDILLKVAAMVGDELSPVRLAAYNALKRQVVLPDTILRSEKLYRQWLRAALTEDICCYVDGGVISLNMPFGNVQLRGNSNDFQRKIRRLQKELGFPSLIRDVGVVECEDAHLS